MTITRYAEKDIKQMVRHAKVDILESFPNAKDFVWELCLNGTDAAIAISYDDNGKRDYFNIAI